jgi:hypothetical protein
VAAALEKSEAWQGSMANNLLRVLRRVLNLTVDWVH